MAEYLDVEKARDLAGLRLVLTIGVPGPWGEAAKALFHVKRIPYRRVGQDPGAPNPELVAWTGRDNAPVAVYADEAPRSGWAELLLLAERLAPEPALIPADAATRALLFGLVHELAGEGGLGWQRRLMMFHTVLSHPQLAESPAGELVSRLGRKYGYAAAAAEAAPARVGQLLQTFSARLRDQRAQGSRFLMGTALTALDLYWAAFAALLDPLPPELCSMSDLLRRQYELRDPALRAQLEPGLLEHRDFVYREYLELPLDL